MDAAAAQRSPPGVMADVSHFRGVRDLRIGFSQGVESERAELPRQRPAPASSIKGVSKHVPIPTRDSPTTDGDREAEIFAASGALSPGATGRAPGAIRRTGHAALGATPDRGTVESRWLRNCLSA